MADQAGPNSSLKAGEGHSIAQGDIDIDMAEINSELGQQDAPKDPKKRPEDSDSGIEINGDSSKLSMLSTPSLTEDEVMKDVGEESKSSLDPYKVPETLVHAVPRRSGRNRKAPTNYEDEYIIPAADESVKTTAVSSRPKRKAAAAAMKTFTSQDDLDFVTETLCAPMVSGELRSYKGWVELESEPKFFEAMLSEMGAPDSKITELVSLDDSSLDALSKPVYGLIFLFPYDTGAQHNIEERQDCPEELWFANQTTANNCATVALMNIAMNIPNAEYGPELKKFRDYTKTLSYHDRGAALDRNEFLRCIHNSVARRTQLLNEDLAWKNQADREERSNRSSKRTVKTPKGRGKARVQVTTASDRASITRKKNQLAKASMHYIAFVPHAGKVWEFDGLEDKPLCLGPHEGGSKDWVKTAIETIQVRMAAGIFSTNFNLLAVSATPLQSMEDRLVQSLAAAQKIEQEYGADGEVGYSAWPHPPVSTTFTQEKLKRLNMTWEMVANIGPTEAFLEKTSLPDFGKEQAALLMAELIVEQNDLEAALAAEITSRQCAKIEYESRQRDFTPFIHQFLLALAEAGQLEETVNNFVERW